MRISIFLLAIVLAPAASRAQSTPLEVLYHAPDDTASSGNIVRVIFDRPVAGRLGSGVDPAAHFTISPSVKGKLEWRDPITMQFTPAIPFTPGDSFAVTIDTTLVAIDGTHLARRFRFSFHVPGPQLLYRSFGTNTGTLPISGKIQLVYSAPVDLGRLNRGLRLDLQACFVRNVPVTVKIRAVRQRPVQREDPYEILYAGPSERDTASSRFRRVVELETSRPLPEDCSASIIIPTTSADGRYGPVESYAVKTPPPFRVTELSCLIGTHCSPDGFRLFFSSDVKPEEIQRHVHIVADSSLDPKASWEERNGPTSAWLYKARLQPRATYTAELDSTLHDVLGRVLQPPYRLRLTMGDRLPAMSAARGILMMPVTATPSIPVYHVNVESIRMISYLIPDALRARALATIRYRWVASGAFDSLGVRPDTTVVNVATALNRETTTEIPLPLSAAHGSSMIALHLEIATILPSYPVQDSAAWGIAREGTKLIVTALSPYELDWAIIQRTGLAVNAKLGAAGGTVLVTGLADGRPRSDVTVQLRDANDVLLDQRRTDRTGTAAVESNPLRPVATVAAIDDTDKVVMPLIGRVIGYEQDALEPRNLGAHLDGVEGMHGAIFTDRGAYRPSEMVYLKGVVRQGDLGALALPLKQSVRIRLLSLSDRYYRDAVPLHDTVIALGDFGTAVDSIRLRPAVPLGQYSVELQVGGTGNWRTIAEDSMRIAEYRAPTFLVEAHADSAPLFGGDTMKVDAAGRFLFGAPMGRAKVFWYATLRESPPWEVHIPGAEGWVVGEWAWSRWTGEDVPEPEKIGGADSLDAAGRVRLRVPLGQLKASRPGRVVVQVAVADVNRQMVSAVVAMPIHPAHLYVLVKPRHASQIWKVGERSLVDVRTVTPDGALLPGVTVRVRVERAQAFGPAGDTATLTDTLRPMSGTAEFSFTPPSGGIYELHFSADDGHGGEARTSLTVFALSGGGWWSRSPERLPIVIDRPTAGIGDRVTATFDSPFDSADAWVTVERERIIEQRIVRAHRGANAFALPVRDVHVPGVFVSVLLLRRGELRGLPDSASERFRVGYAELRVSTDEKRLSVNVAPHSAAYLPGDSVRIHVQVRDAGGHGVKSEIALWAVDEGVLALTAYEAPDLVARVFVMRGLGARLWSTLPSLLTSDPWLMTGSRPMSFMLGEVVVGEGVHEFELPSAPLRKEFRSTAFFLGSVRTDGAGEAEASAKLPDDITTYRVMAVAVSVDAHFGRGDAKLLATRSLVLRPSLPRFVRIGDSLFAGAVVNVRDGKARTATVNVTGEGLKVIGPTGREIELAAGQGGEARFHFAAPGRESKTDDVSVRFDASDKVDADAVQVRLPVRPDFHARTHTILGVLHDTAEVTMKLPSGIDPERSHFSLRLGVSSLAPMLAAYERLRDYPFDCTEQLSSVGRALIAVARVRRGSSEAPLDSATRSRLQLYADKLARRQQRDGSISYWTGAEWSSPWLTSYAGLFLLEAKAEGIAIAPAVISNATEYLKRSLRGAILGGGANRFEQRDRRLALGDQVATVDFLRRAGAADLAAEDQLRQLAPTMTWEDRLRLAEVLAARPDRRRDARALVDAAWATVMPAGLRVDLPDSSLTVREFPSHIAPAARLLTATIALRANEPMLGALVETILQTGRAEDRWAWSTQDYASTVLALAAFAHGATAPRAMRASAAGRTLISVSGADTSVSAPLAGALVREKDGGVSLRLRVDVAPGAGFVYYAVSVSEVPSEPPVTPDARGILVERWYERYSDGRPVTSVREGELVRVRLRITVPTDREFVALEDPLPAGLEPVDLSLHTASTLEPFVVPEWNRDPETEELQREMSSGSRWQNWLYGSWDGGWWQPWEHKALYDDRVVYFARMLWRGSYSASYIARATTAGTFTRAPAHAEEMYNEALSGRSDGGRFEIEASTP